MAFRRSSAIPTRAVEDAAPSGSSPSGARPLSQSGVPGTGGISLWAQLTLLPLDAQVYLMAVLLIAAAPTVVLVLAQLGSDGPTLALLGQHPIPLFLAAFGALVAVTLLLERPAVPGLRRYLAQLHGRFRAVQQQHHQAALARLSKEKTR